MSDCSTHAFDVPLRECPFCSAKPEVLSDGRRTWGLVQHNEGCLFPIYPKHEIPESDFAAWNSRAERMCKVEVRESAWGGYTRRCGNCGADLDCDTRNKQNYCPNCGAKVVGE